MKKRNIALIIIILLIIILVGVIIYNVFFKANSFTPNNKEEIKPDIKEQLIIKLEELYGDENSTIEFSNENEKVYIFIKKLNEDDSRVERYDILKEDLDNITVSPILGITGE